MIGCVHIYCGDGKGKTSSSIGLSVRAAGCGKKVLITRFLKTDYSGEVVALSHIPGIEVTPCEKSFGFFTKMSDEQKLQAKEYYGHLLEYTLNKLREGHYDMVVMDEIMAVCNYGLVEEARIIQFLKDRDKSLEVVLTGRNPSDKLIELADYVSEIKKIKHPYDQGIGARKGIEY